MRRTLTLLAAVAMLALAMSGMAALPTVDITGVSGAANWLWFEGENYSALYQGGPSAAYGNSGYRTTSETGGPNSWVQLNYVSGLPNIQWNIHAPGNMSANTKVIIAGASHYGSGLDFYVDGGYVNAMTSMYVSNWGMPWGYWSGGVNLGGALTAGDHTLKMENRQYEIIGLDGILLYDGDISLAGHPGMGQYSYDYLYPTFWMNAATIQPNSRPSITAASVTPNFTVNGQLGVSYFISQDDVVSEYVPGTAITESGAYRVWAEAWASTDPNAENLVPQERIVAGVDFILVGARPEPSVDISGVDGAAPWLWVEGEDASAFVDGGPNFRPSDLFSGYLGGETSPNNRGFMAYEPIAPAMQTRLYIPADMSANWKLILHCSSHFGKSTDVKIDNVRVGSFLWPGDSAFGDTPFWTEFSVPAGISRGSHVIRFENVTDYEVYSLDGYLIYGGDISDTGNPSLVTYPAGEKWMDANFTPNTYPLISAPSVTPVFDVTGTALGGVSYWLAKDGAAKAAYVPGTAISGPGQYRVWAEAWAGQWTGNPNMAAKRILAGVDFELQGAGISTLKEAKVAADGSSVAISGAVVSASFSGYLYIQDGKACGIRVDKDGLSVATPTKVDVVGTVQTNDDGERYIEASMVTPVTSTETVAPVGLANKSVGGGDYDYTTFPVQAGQQGVDSGAGLNNVGLLVRVWGKVSPVDSTTFMVTDGSGVDVYVESLGGGLPSGAPYVTVTGACSCKMIDGKIQRIIRVDNPGKIAVVPGT